MTGGDYAPDPTVRVAEVQLPEPEVQQGGNPNVGGETRAPTVMQQVPSVGRIVHFYTTARGNILGERLGPYAAIIVEAIEGNPDQAVNLVVMSTWCATKVETSVPRRKNDVDEQLMWWEWPPHVPAVPAAGNPHLGGDPRFDRSI
jgi:hypothetical protein